MYVCMCVCMQIIYQNINGHEERFTRIFKAFMHAYVLALLLHFTSMEELLHNSEIQ